MARPELLRQGEEIMVSRDPGHRFMDRVTVVVMALHGYCTVAQAALRDPGTTRRGFGRAHFPANGMKTPRRGMNLKK